MEKNQYADCHVGVSRIRNRVRIRRYEGDPAEQEIIILTQAGIINRINDITKGALVGLLEEGLRARTSADFTGLFANRDRSDDMLTRSAAAKLTAKAYVFLRTPQAACQVTLDRVRVADDVDKVTLTWPDRPNAGYRIRIEGIDFAYGEGGERSAILRYSLQGPEPGSMNAQVITNATAVAYVASEVKLTLKQVK